MKSDKEIEESNRIHQEELRYLRAKLMHYNEWLLSDRQSGTLYPGFIEDIEEGSRYEIPDEVPHIGRPRKTIKKGKKK